MAALIETMFSSGNQVPWHGLGTIVNEAPTSADALHLAGLDWNVLQRPIYTDGVEIPNMKANVRDTDKSVLGVVSDRYQVVQNKEAFDFTDNLIQSGEVKYETAGSLSGGKRIWLLAKMPESKVLDDKVDPYIVFTNSHDGTGAIKVAMTPIRVVCNNTLNLALEGAKRCWSTKHIGDITSKLEEARHTLKMANEYMKELDAQADRFVNIKITDEKLEEILKDLFPVNAEDTDRRKNNMQEMKDKYMICYFAPDIAKFRGTAWGAINAMSDFATHIAPKRVTGTYAEKNWGRIIDGHYLIDSMVSKVSA